VKASFNPIAAFYQDSMQAWIYANSEDAETRDLVVQIPGTTIGSCYKTAIGVIGSRTPKKRLINGLGKKRRNKHCRMCCPPELTILA
jgi:hypothetical protein